MLVYPLGVEQYTTIIVLITASRQDHLPHMYRIAKSGSANSEHSRTP